MAKKEEISLIDSFAEFKESKSIDRDTMVSVIEESLRKAIASTYGSDENYNVTINPEKGDFEITHKRVIVDDGMVDNEDSQVSLADARKVDPTYVVGEEMYEKVDFTKFGRRAVLNLRQTLASKILELQKDALYNKYKDKIGKIVSGEVYKSWKRELMLADEEDNEMILPRTEQIPSENFREGDHIRAVVAKVDNENGKPKIILSRTADLFLKRLFEEDIPEIADGLITIKAIARIPGERAKVAVESYDDKIDPVGACVGMGGSRIRGIVKELKNENIDVISYTQNTALFIQRALAPARINSIQLYDDVDRDGNKKIKASVYLNPEEVSLAIGKNGMNIKLAGMITGCEIEVYRDVDNGGADYADGDIYLDEFNDEIDQWVIDEFKKAGYDTALNVLNDPREQLIERTDLEEETIDHVISVLKTEFEDTEA